MAVWGGTINRLHSLNTSRTDFVYPIGWAHAMDEPFHWAKPITSHYGGTCNGMVTSCSSRIKDTGGILDQWHHVIILCQWFFMPSDWRSR